MSARDVARRNRETRLLAFIDLFQTVHHRAPSYAQMAQGAHMRHETQAVRDIASLIRRGVLKRHADGMFRMIGAKSHASLRAEAGASL